MIRLGHESGARRVDLWLYEKTKRDIRWQAHCVSPCRSKRDPTKRQSHPGTMLLDFQAFRSLK